MDEACVDSVPVELPSALASAVALLVLVDSSLVRVAIDATWDEMDVLMLETLLFNTAMDETWVEIEAAWVASVVDCVFTVVFSELMDDN